MGSQQFQSMECSAQDGQEERCPDNLLRSTDPCHVQPHFVQLVWDNLWEGVAIICIYTEVLWALVTLHALTTGLVHDLLHGWCLRSMTSSVGNTPSGRTQSNNNTTD